LTLFSIYTATPVPTSLLGSMLLALLAVLALIMILAWLVKRFPGSALHCHNQIKMIAHLNLGQRERLLVIEVGDQQLLLGITNQHINCLHILPEPLLTSSAYSAPVLPQFAHFMRQKTSKNSANEVA